jgi:3-oxoacyl-[acyl-carrier-protein] synthase II
MPAGSSLGQNCGMASSPLPRVLITGLGAVTPYGTGVGVLERGLFAGKSAIRPITGFDAGHLDVRIAGEVPDFRPADSIASRPARRMDRFAQFAVAASREAIESAGLDLTRVDRSRVATVIHTGAGGIPALVEAASVVRERSPRAAPPLMIAKYAPNMASGHVSIELGLTAPSLTGTGACASGTIALIEGMQLIQRGEADVVVAGGAEACVTKIGIVGFDNLGVLSHRNDDPAGANRPFSLDRDGTVLSEGACVFVLEAEGHAVRRDARAHAELAGAGMTSDGYHLTAPDPTGEYLAKAIHLALAQAALQPDAVDLIAAHATGSIAGDVAETVAIKRAFGPHASRLAVTAVKSMVGHMIGAAGALAAMAIVLGMGRGQISSTINLHVADPACDLDYVPLKTRDRDVQVALTAGLGFGGQNAVVIVRKSY